MQKRATRTGTVIDHEGTVHAADNTHPSPYAAACGYPPRMRDGNPWPQTTHTQPSYHWAQTPITCQWCNANR